MRACASSLSIVLFVGVCALTGDPIFLAVTEYRRECEEFQRKEASRAEAARREAERLQVGGLFLAPSQPCAG